MHPALKVLREPQGKAASFDSAVLAETYPNKSMQDFEMAPTKDFCVMDEEARYQAARLDEEVDDCGSFTTLPDEQMGQDEYESYYSDESALDSEDADVDTTGSWGSPYDSDETAFTDPEEGDATTSCEYGESNPSADDGAEWEGTEVSACYGTW